MTDREIPILRACPACGKTRMSTKARRFHKRCRKENAKLSRLAEGAIARLPERGKKEDDDA